MMNDALATASGMLFLKGELEPSDLLDGRGGDKTHDKAHQAFLDLKDEHHPEYKNYTTNKDKQRCRDTVIETLQRNGTRFFISIVGKSGFYRFMTIDEIRRKVSQALREPRKSKQAGCPFVSDPESDYHHQVTYALDSVESAVSDHEDNEAMDIEHVDDHKQYEIYQEEIEAGEKNEGRHDENIDWIHEFDADSFADTEGKSFTSLFDLIDDVDSFMLHAEFPNHHVIDAATDFAMVHCEPIQWKIGITDDNLSVDEVD